MPKGQIEDTSNYQQYPDGVPIEHNGAAYFLKMLSDMGFEVSFREEKGYWHVTRDPQGSLKWFHEPEATGHHIVVKKSNKILYTEKAAKSREKAMGNVLDLLCNSYLLNADENWLGVIQLNLN